MKHAFLPIGLLAGALALGGSPLRAGGAKAATAPAARQLREAGFVSIGGIEQWITVRGDSSANPVILFLHGGPGNPLSPYADAIYGAWEKDFTLVQWDQRGAGRTYGHSRPAADAALSLERMRDDGIQLAEYLIRHLGQRKIILMGGSWGSILGVEMAKARPELFYAYVGASQMVSARENLAASYARTLELVRAAGDQATLSKLEALGAPPWTNPRGFGILRRATRAYEAKSTTPAPESWWQRAPDYDTPQMQADETDGEDYSYLQYVGLQGDGMLSKVDLPKLGTAFGVPVFLVQGSEDLVTVPSVGKRYFDSLSAPQKAYVLVPKAGHDPNAAMVEAEYRVMQERVRPLTEIR